MIDHYSYEQAFDEKAMEEVLRCAVRARIVEEYDTGAGKCVWFEGERSAGLRAVHERVKTVLAGAGCPKRWR